MIGDIHGELDGLKKILIHSRLVNEKDDWIGEKSILIQTGDVIDRGPHSWGCVRLLRSRALFHPQHTKSSINILHERGRKVKKSSLIHQLVRSFHQTDLTKETADLLLHQKMGEKWT